MREPVLAKYGADSNVTNLTRCVQHFGEEQAH